MRRFFNLQALGAGTGIAAGATALSFALAAWGFGNLYYVSVFMPFAMLACLTVAWFSFLRDDGFTHRLPEAGPVALDRATAGPAPMDMKTPEPHEGRLDPALFAPRDGTLVSGRAESASIHHGSLGRAALLWAALELGGGSALLYSIAGLGARFFR